MAARIAGVGEMDNSLDVIDSRDIDAFIDELEAEEYHSEEDTSMLEAFKALRQQAEEVTGNWGRGLAYGDSRWQRESRGLARRSCHYRGSGGRLVRDSYFEQYAQEVAEDLIGSELLASWPHTCIDWKLAVSELQSEYAALDFGGVTYWISRD